MIGLEGGRVNLVPVDFVVAAIDHLAHLEGLDGRCFHLTDPHPCRVGEILNMFAHARRTRRTSPFASMRPAAATFQAPVLSGLTALTPFSRIARC